MRTRRWIVSSAAAAVAFGTVVVTVLNTHPVDELALHSLPEGVSAHEIQGVHVFLIREGREVRGFLDSAQHLRGERLWWCVEEEVFLSPAHGELFDPEGRLIEGPAFRDLDRLKVTVTADGLVQAGPRKVRLGKVRRGVGLGSAGVRPEVWVAYRGLLDRADGSRPFCQQRIEAGDTTRS